MVLVYCLTLGVTILKKNLAGRYIIDFVNKTSRDKGGAGTNEKQKQCIRIPSGNTLGRNYPFVGYPHLVGFRRFKRFSSD